MSDDIKNIVSEEQELIQTQEVRKRIVTHLMSDGVPKDPESMNFLLKALSDSDKSSLGRMKVKSDEKNAGIMAGGSAFIAEVLKATQVRNLVGDAKDVAAPVLPDTVPKPDLVPGETHIGTKVILSKE